VSCLPKEPPECPRCQAQTRWEGHVTICENGHHVTHMCLDDAFPPVRAVSKEWEEEQVRGRDG
jgi:hypothetical protein